MRSHYFFQPLKAMSCNIDNIIDSSSDINVVILIFYPPSPENNSQETVLNSRSKAGIVFP
jgi:hypothetical protein